MLTSDAPAGHPRPYSTRLRTALVLTGTGTAGAYHAGVLRALHEAGVRIDLVAGRGIGALGAIFAAVDGGQRLWDREGLWKQPSIAQAYRWRLPLRVAGWAMVVAAALLALPLALFGIGVLAALIAVLLALSDPDVGLVRGHRRLRQRPRHALCPGRAADDRSATDRLLHAGRGGVADRRGWRRACGVPPRGGGWGRA